MSNVELVLDSGIYSGWKSVSVTRDLNTISGAFELSVNDLDPKDRKRKEIAPDMTAKVLLDGEQVISGWIDDVDISVKGNSHDLVIRGRDKTGDLVDCAADFGQRNFPEQYAQQIVAAICKPYGITVKLEADQGKTFKKITVQPGETAFETIDRVCRHRGLIPYSDRQGNLILGTRSNIHQGILEQGVNVMSFTGTNSHKERFSDYRVYGQENASILTDAEKTTHPKAEAKDPGVRRFRPRSIIAETGGDDGRFVDRVNFEMNRRAGLSKAVKLPVQGWRNDNGDIWDINRIVKVKADLLRIDADMLITKTQFQKDASGGTITTLNCSLPAAFDRFPVPETQSVGLFG